ncbi:MAG: hypothetical protein ACE5K2_03780, partial [Candidatus Zixiibacteriota bacterium]
MKKLNSLRKVFHVRRGVQPLSAEAGRWLVLKAFPEGFNPRPNEDGCIPSVILSPKGEESKNQLKIPAKGDPSHPPEAGMPRFAQHDNCVAEGLSLRPAMKAGLYNLSKSIKALLLILLFLLFSAPAFGQYYFGKNKIQYTDFEWQILTTDHFEVYFYPEEKEIAEIAANYAEESYKFLENKFNHHIEKKLPLVIYSSPNYFEQTNVIPTLLPENVAGFTEFFKGRMVIPFDGSYFRFRRVIRHELVHAFIMEKLPYVMKAHRRHN